MSATLRGSDSDGATTTVMTLPEALARGPGVHVSVRVELTNGAVLSGQLVELDAATMNLRLDALTHTAVVRHRSNNNNDSDTAATTEVEDAPVALRCLHSIVVRGACVRYVDFVDRHVVDDILDATRAVRPASA